MILLIIGFESINNFNTIKVKNIFFFIVITLTSLPWAFLYLRVFKKKFSQKHSLLKNCFIGVLASTLTALSTSLVGILGASIFSTYQGDGLNSMYFHPMYISSILLFCFIASLPSILTSGLLLGWLNYKATSSHQ